MSNDAIDEYVHFKLLLDRMIDPLGPKQKLYILLHLLGCDTKVIAQVTGDKPANVKRSISFAKQNMRKVIEDGTD